MPDTFAPNVLVGRERTFATPADLAAWLAGTGIGFLYGPQEAADVIFRDLRLLHRDGYVPYGCGHTFAGVGPGVFVSLVADAERGTVSAQKMRPNPDYVDPFTGERPYARAALSGPTDEAPSPDA